MDFGDIFKNRATRAVISFENLKHNFKIVRSYLDPHVKIMAAVKANAYGHGILEISRALIDMGCDYLAVAYVEEAVFLRQSGIKSPILVMGPANEEQLELYFDHDIDICASSIDKLNQIAGIAQKKNKQANIHLKIDTGMERIGVHSYHAKEFVDYALSLKSVTIKGLFSHLAKSEEDVSFTNHQITEFRSIVDYMDKKGVKPELCHLANSGGIVRHKEAHFDMVRPGIALYGYFEEIQDRLKPVMSLFSKVSYFKVVPANTGIGYGHAYITTHQTRIATLPVGYGDGYRRSLGGKAYVSIRGRKYPVVGRVCMDQMMVDLGMDGEAYPNDDVLLWGENKQGEYIDLNELTRSLDTIPYEVLCGISQRVPRIYQD